MKDRQVIEAKGGSTISHIIQAVIHLPPWAWVVGIVILAITALLVAGIFNIGPLRTLLPTPMAFAPASESESLIIVADFDDRSDGRYQGVDSAQYIYEKLVAQARADGLDVRIERLHQVINDNTVRSVGEVYNATLVLWGWYDALTITPRIERIQTRFDFIFTGEGQHISLVAPERIEYIVITDLPSQVTYLALVTLGLERLAAGDEYGSLACMDSALATIPEDVEVSVNPSGAYLIRGIIYLLRGDYSRSRADLSMVITLNPEIAWAYANRAITYSYEGDHDRAMEDLARAIELQPDSALIYLIRAMAYQWAGDYDQSVEDYTQAIHLQPDFAPTYCYRGTAYLQQGKYDRAMEDLDRATQLQPSLAMPYSYRGAICLIRSLDYCITGDYDDALIELDRAVAEYDQGIQYQTDLAAGKMKLTFSYEGRAMPMITTDSYDRRFFTQAYLARGYSHSLRAAAYFSTYDYDRAVADFDQAIADFNEIMRLHPDAAFAYIAHGSVYLARGSIYSAMDSYDRASSDFDQAIADFDRAIQLRPDSAQAHIGRGNVYFQRGTTHFLHDYEHAIIELDQAIDDYKQGLQLGFDLDEIMPFLADLGLDTQLELNPTQAARVQPYLDWTIESYQILLAKAHCMRGVSYAGIGDYDQAISDYEQAIRLQADYAIPFQYEYARAYHNRGLASYHEGNYQDAVADFEQAIQLQPNSAEAYYVRGLAYAGMGNLDRAIADYNQALVLQPYYADIYFGRAVAYMQGMSEDEAIADFERFLELSADPYWREQAEQHLRELRGDQP